MAAVFAADVPRRSLARLAQLFALGAQAVAQIVASRRLAAHSWMGATIHRGMKRQRGAARPRREEQGVWVGEIGSD
jgi:hypothetical protein